MAACLFFFFFPQRKNDFLFYFFFSYSLAMSSNDCVWCRFFVYVYLFGLFFTFCFFCFFLAWKYNLRNTAEQTYRSCILLFILYTGLVPILIFFLNMLPYLTAGKYFVILEYFENQFRLTAINICVNESRHSFLLIK